MIATENTGIHQKSPCFSIIVTCPIMLTCEQRYIASQILGITIRQDTCVKEITGFCISLITRPIGNTLPIRKRTSPVLIKQTHLGTPVTTVNKEAASTDIVKEHHITIIKSVDVCSCPTSSLCVYLRTTHQPCQ